MEREIKAERVAKKRLRLLRMRDRFQGKAFLIPSFVTVIGIFCGFLAILSSLQGKFDYAAKCILIAIVLDGLDGRIARRLNATSAFGREFDSLSDMVAFGVAPAVLVYSWAFASQIDQFGILVSFALVVCGATRLARFNIMTEYRKHFSGLPIPGAAAALACWVFLRPQPLDSPALIYLMAGYTLMLSFLMVSTITFFSLKHLKLGESNNPRLMLVLIAAVVALGWYQSTATIALISTGYAISGPIGYLFTKRPLALTTPFRKSGGM